MGKMVDLTYGGFALRPLTCADVTDRYLKWVHDEDVTEFLEMRYHRYTLEDLVEYVRSFEGDSTRFLFGIFDVGTTEHIGNASVNLVNYHTGTFDMGYFVGEKQYWGSPAALATILLMLKFSFKQLGLRKFFGGVYANHTKVRFLMTRMGFTQEARLKERFVHKGKPVDEIIHSLDREQWQVMKAKYGV